MTQESYRHPITPPPELVQKWLGEHFGCEVTGEVSLPELHLATRAAQWGSDQELEACCAFAQNQAWGLVNGPHVADVIRAARRPKPPSLKQQALEALNRHQSETWCEEMDADIAVIRRALESLPENP